jgi:hypothetical protein
MAQDATTAMTAPKGYILTPEDEHGYLLEVYRQDPRRPGQSWLVGSIEMRNDSPRPFVAYVEGLPHRTNRLATAQQALDYIVRMAR